MSGASIKIGISPRNLPKPKLRTEPAWKKPVIDYPKDATIKEVPYKWEPSPKKPEKKEKPKPFTIRKQPAASKKPTPKPKIKRTFYQLSDHERRMWTEKEIKTLIVMYNDGASYIEMSEAVRHSESSIATKLSNLRKEGLISSIRSKEEWTEEQVETLLGMKAKGYTLEEISRVIGRSYAAASIKYKRIKEEEECGEE